ncbi:helix-turn-helix transcriptional regulator [Methanolobus chelungpuianus]|uniref:Transcriptional regulator n=1 Tax=Methanolobus chelungpuianus TaxID=502115 RepID=A0AAE3HAB2_9EURY|nr:winged helix-turn-helix domain-containing protein [Methanolobus chelungpuianus]MCQ6963032.1 transcriptional regulator [Methanolobus chelungpuianus]
MKKSLLDIIFASDKRKNVLLLLQDGVKEMDDILVSLKTNRQSLLPQMRMLEEHYLVSHTLDRYELTTIGKLVVDEMAHLLGIIQPFENDIDYWGSRNLDFIPSHLFGKIYKLRNCEIINPDLTELFSIHKSLNPGYSLSRSVYTVTTILYPNFEPIIKELLESGLTLHYIFSREVFDKIKAEYQAVFADLIKNESFNMYVYNKNMDLLYFTFDDTHSLTCMLKNNGEFDHRFMLCRGHDPVDWNRELYEYYLKDSVPVREI